MTATIEHTDEAPRQIVGTWFTIAGNPDAGRGEPYPWTIGGHILAQGEGFYLFRSYDLGAGGPDGDGFVQAGDLETLAADFIRADSTRREAGATRITWYATREEWAEDCRNIAATMARSGARQ